MATLGDRIKWRRRDMNMTQQQLADAVRKIKPDFSGAQSTIQAIEGGKSKDPTIVCEISKVLNLSVEYLRTGEEDFELPSVDEIARLRKENEKLRNIIKNLL